MDYVTIEKIEAPNVHVRTVQNEEKVLSLACYQLEETDWKYLDQLKEMEAYVSYDAENGILLLFEKEGQF